MREVQENVRIPSFGEQPGLPHRPFLGEIAEHVSIGGILT